MPASSVYFITTHCTQWGAIDELGVGYLAAVLEARGCRTAIRQIADGDDGAVDRLLSELARDGPVLVGFACSHRTPELRQFDALCAAVRRTLPSAHLTAGGYWASFNSAELLRHIAALDSVVVGEGEPVVPELVDDLVAGRDWRALAGVVTRTTSLRSGRIVSDLNALPFPQRRAQAGSADVLTSISTSRGCMAHCTFCNVPGWMRQFGGGAWRGRNVPNVLDEIAAVVRETGSRRFWIVDSSFEDPLPLGLERLRAFATEILRRRLAIRFYTFHRAESVARSFPPDLLPLLREAGLRRVFLGVESASDRVLKGFAKRARTADVAKALADLRGLDLAVRCGFIMFTPESTASSLAANVAFLARHRLLHSTTDLLTRLELYTGAAEVEKLRKQGLLDGEYWRDPLAYRFVDESARWLAERLCPLRAGLAGRAQWEAGHTADLVGASAARDPAVAADRALAGKVRAFSAEVAELKAGLAASNETFMQEAIGVAWGRKSERTLARLVTAHIERIHIGAAQVLDAITTELLLEIRRRVPTFIY